MSCENKITGEFHPNRPPETYVFIQSEDTLNYTRSIQSLFWDGRDPDGYITGFYYTFEENPAEEDWQWTTSRRATFPLKITGKDTIYIFQVKAVDNQGLEDPTPAHQHFPIKNSPPSISWTQLSQLPDTTFTVASFIWNASDPDGDSSIVAFEYALDDTAEWRQISGQRRNITLNVDSGLVAGDHAFYIRAVDISGARSQIIRMPEVEDQFWHVKEPRGRYLLIDDYAVESSNTGFPDAFYHNLLNELLPEWGDDFSYWNIEKQFPKSQIQFTETLKLFDRIIWYTDVITETDDHFIAAQLALPEFLSQGGKIIYSVQFNKGFGAQGDPLEFSPVDSLGDFYNFINANSIYQPDAAFTAAFPNLPPLPELKLSKFVVGLISLEPRVTAIPMYRYDDPNKTTDPIFIMAGRNDDGVYNFVFSGTPLHFLNGNDNLEEVFRIILGQLF